jgi:4-amino-4-deoxy-L-arabinose transferase-like glycosyltransferase
VVGVAAACLQPWEAAEPDAVLRTPPDETAHVVYIDYLARTHRFPVLASGAGLYEAHQPPLYYVLALPARQVGLALDPPATESLGPTMGEVFALRVWSVFIATGVVVACYLVACAVFPRSPVRQVAVPLFALLLPGHIVNLAAVTNDGLAELFACLALWIAITIARERNTAPRRVGALGLVIGLGLLTKTSCLFLLPVALVAVGLACSRPGSAGFAWRRFAVGAATVVLVALLLWSGWIIRNLAVYPGDPLVTRTFVEVFGRDRATPETFFALGLSFAGYLRLVLSWTYLSFWGVFGQAVVFMAGWYYAVGSAIALGAALGLAASVRQWRRATPEARVAWSILVVASILVGLQFLQFNMSFFQAQARYLLPAIAPIACAFVAGLGRLGRPLAGRAGSAEKGRAWILGGFGLALLVMLLSALVEVASRAPVTPPPGWIGLP